jgi:hypothetical protein
MSATLAEISERPHGVVPREVLTAGSGLAFLQGLQRRRPELSQVGPLSGIHAERNAARFGQG